MKYLIRAAKYYLYILIILVIVIFVLVKLDIANSDPAEMFRNGYDSLWQIALILLAFSAIYPKFGYGTRHLRAPGSYSELRGEIMDYMDGRGYRIKEERDETMVFVHRAPLTRLFKMFEDEITLTREMTGYSVEGHVKDVVRIVGGLQNRLENR